MSPDATHTAPTVILLLIEEQEYLSPCLGIRKEFTILTNHAYDSFVVKIFHTGCATLLNYVLYMLKQSIQFCVSSGLPE